MGSITQHNTTSRTTMKLLVLSALLSLCSAAVTKVVNVDPHAYGYGYSGYPYTAGYGYPGYPYSYTAPSAAPVAPIPAPFAPVPRNLGSQFHAQDELGNLHYGYTNVVSAKREQGNTYGGVSGGYSYVDASGILQRVQYIADNAGFRVADSRLPVAPVYEGVAPTFTPSLPVAPEDTAEVADAKAAFAEAFAAQEAAVAAVATPEEN